MASALSRVHARSALLGNPSDGFGGAAIAFTVEARSSVIKAADADLVTIEAGGRRLEFATPEDLVLAGNAGAYPPGGPAALLMAAAKRFTEAYGDAGGFALREVGSTIPPQVGLAGSSATVIGCLRSLARIRGHEFESAELAELALACETDELGITAGLQDRVVQSFGGCVFMELDPARAEGDARFERLDPNLLPAWFIAYLPGAESDSGATHRDTRERYERGEPVFVATMDRIAGLAREGRDALIGGDTERLGELMRRNFDLRREVYDLDPRHVKLIEIADSLGAPANYTGSGGAIVGLVPDGVGAATLREAFESGAQADLIVPGER